MFKGLEVLVKEGDMKTFGTAWSYGPVHRFVKNAPLNPAHKNWQLQKKALTEYGNLPGEEHFSYELCTYSPEGMDRTTDPTHPVLTWPEDYQGYRWRRVGVMGDFWNQLMSHRPSWVAAWMATGKSPTADLQQYLERCLDGREMDPDDDQDGPLLPSSLGRLQEHPIHMVFGYIVSKKGFGFDLRKFKTFAAFEKVITYKFVAKVLAICIKAGMY
jgi:hypothetical protein